MPAFHRHSTAGKARQWDLVPSLVSWLVVESAPEAGSVTPCCDSSNACFTLLVDLGETGPLRRRFPIGGSPRQEVPIQTICKNFTLIMIISIQYIILLRVLDLNFLRF